MLIRRSLSVLFLLIFAIGLQQAIRSVPPRLVDQCDRDGDSRQSAPIIIVGVIQSDTLIVPVPMHSDRTRRLQLRRMRVAVENVLRGAIKQERVDIYYFTWGGAFNGPQPLGMWSSGSRRLFWLRRDGDLLRTACDGWDGCTWGVYSGRHPHLKETPGDPIERTVAGIVLTRGEGRINEARFSGAILRGAPVPDSYLIEDYRHLAAAELAGVKAAACEALWILSHDAPLREAAEDGMLRAHCNCRVSERGEPDCGPKGYIHDDPPF
jgi:hypothetical protein